jgi:beta-alanine degradation protein BauB
MPGFRAAIPAVATTLIDDDRTRVIRWDFEPGAETGHHVHGLAYVIVPMTDLTIRIEDANGTSDHLIKSGAAYSRPTGVEHNVINAGTAPMSFIEVEMKR